MSTLKKEGRIYLDANRADNPTLVASTKCGIREETSVDSLPEWPDDSRLLLELHDGKVVCDHLQNAALFDGEILVLNKGRLRFIGTAFTITTRGEQLRIAVAKGTLEFTFFEGVTDDERVATIQAGQVLIFVPELELRRWHLLPAAFPVEDSNLFAEFGISVQPDTTAPTFGDPPGFTAITWDIARKEPVAGPENTLVVTFSEPIDPYSVSPGDFLIDATVPVFTEWFGEMPNAVFATIRGRVSPKESAIVEMVGEILDLAGTAMRPARAELRPGCELDCVAGSLPPPVVRAGGHELVDRPDVPFRDPLFIEISFEASPRGVAITSIALDGDDLTDQVTTPDDIRFLVAITGIAPGEHKLVVMAEDDVGNKLAEQLEVVFTVGARESFAIELIPGWNFLSIPVDPANPSINAVFADMAGVSVVVTYDPSIPGRFLTAVRGADGNFAGTLRTVQSARAYWVQTDAFETVELGVPVLAVPGAQPLALPIVEGWNLVPVLDITGMKGAGETILARDYFASAEHITTVFSFDTRANEWKVVSISPNSTATVEVGRAYWVFSATASNLVLAP